MEDVPFYLENYPEEILNQFRTFRECGLFCDLAIMMGDTVIKAHRIVLACFSPFLKTLLQNDELTDDISIQFQDVRVDTLKLLFDLAYGEKIIISTENVQELLLASKYFSVESLREKCELFASYHIDTDNCVDVLEFASIHELKILKAGTLDVIPDDVEYFRNLETNPDQLLKIFGDSSIIFKQNGLPLSREDREVFLLKWIQKHISNNPEDTIRLPDYMQQMRIPNISTKTLMQIIETIPKQQENEIVAHVLRLATLVRSGRSDPEVPPFWTSETSQGCWNLTKTDLFSKETGVNPPIESFDDFKVIAPHIAMTKITLYFRPWCTIYVLGGIEVTYDDGEVVSHGLRRKYASITQHDIKLQKMEWINEVNVWHGWLIDDLIFKTNKGRAFGPFTESRNGGKSVVRAGNGRYNHLHSFTGNITLESNKSGNVAFDKKYKCISQIGFTWSNYEIGNI